MSDYSHSTPSGLNDLFLILNPECNSGLIIFNPFRVEEISNHSKTRTLIEDIHIQPLQG